MAFYFRPDNDRLIKLLSLLSPIESAVLVVVFSYFGPFFGRLLADEPTRLSQHVCVYSETLIMMIIIRYWLLGKGTARRIAL